MDPHRLRRALDATLANASGIAPEGGMTQVTVKMSKRREPPKPGSPAVGPD